MKESRVTVVVLTYNRVQEVLRTLHHLSGLDEQPPIIVVDNGSSDGTGSLVAERYSRVTVIRLASNIGAAARNAGASFTPSPVTATTSRLRWSAVTTRSF